MEKNSVIVPAIVLVGYNRVESMKRLLNSVVDAHYDRNDIPLIISLDHSNKTKELRELVKNQKWDHGEKRIITYKKNLGLKEHILKCGDLSEQYGAVVILEDDLVVSKDFYSFVFQAVNYYGDDNRVAGISLYTHAWNGFAKRVFVPQKNNYDVFMGQFSISWGQCWTSRVWKEFRQWLNDKECKQLTDIRVPKEIETYGQNSWGKYFAFFLVDKQRYYVIPYISLSTNYSEPGVHTKTSDTTHQVMLMDCSDYTYRFPEFEQAVKYNMFFEREISEDIYSGEVNLEDVCFDLNGILRDYQGKRYIATTRKAARITPYKSYGISLRPIEQNVIKNISGEGINLYETQKVKIEDLSKRNLILAKYDLYDYSMIVTVMYILVTIKECFVRKFIGLIRKTIGFSR